MYRPRGRDSLEAVRVKIEIVRVLAVSNSTHRGLDGAHPCLESAYTVMAVRLL